MASASAHGQVMISTAMAVTMASCSEAPATSQPIAVERRGRVHDRARRAARRGRRAAGSATSPPSPFPAAARPRQSACRRRRRSTRTRQRAGEIDAAGVDHRAGRDRAARGFAGDQAFVDLRCAGDDGAVGRNRVRPAAPAARSPGRSAATGTRVTSPLRSSRCAISAFSAARLPATARVLRRIA